ncbi:hypothetical protein H4R34_002977 [Dimargaris verticillata]|uniref:Major facilitator superfamily (MFS) profile domain-containing protein n=1 Tax=Dimargaris verticillata TaxID=2761393 RepID=A0A9W8B5H8_9FUNG|nr:hypothetical protein H4R34_002977 [Dimargaris verticillata]
MPATASAQPETPLPKGQLAVILLTRFSEPVSFTVLFPFVYFMVRDFDVAETPEQIGYFVGIVASSFSIAQMFTGMFWGFLSDRIGRRPVILVGILGTALCSALFGFSKSLGWAVMSRALWGAINGNASVSKTIMGEITDETNQARGFSILPLGWNLGSILGPILGGMLASPVENYPFLFGNSELLRTYPYLLPCLVCSCISLFTFIIALIFLEETLPSIAQKKQSSAATLAIDARPSETTLRTETTPLNAVLPDSSATLARNSYLTLRGSSSSLHSSSLACSVSDGDDEICSDCSSVAQLETQQFTWWQSLRDAFNHHAVGCAVGYAFLSLVTIMLDELYPVWAATAPRLGGFGYSTRSIGLTLTSSSIVVVYLQLVVYPRWQHKWGPLGCFRRGLMLISIASFILPFLNIMVRVWGDSLAVSPIPTSFGGTITFALSPWTQAPNAPPPFTGTAAWVSWGIVVATLLLRFCGGVMSFTSSNILIVNSVASHSSLGTVNGFNQTLGALARAIGPLLAGSIWSWSLTQHLPFPLDFHLVFNFIALISFSTCIYTLTWDPRVDRRMCEFGLSIKARHPRADESCSV